MRFPRPFVFDLNQSQQALPGRVDIHNHPHLCNIEFPAVDIKGVSILVGNNVPYAYIQKEVRVAEDVRKGLNGGLLYFERPFK